MRFFFVGDEILPSFTGIIINHLYVLNNQYFIESFVRRSLSVPHLVIWNSPENYRAELAAGKYPAVQ